MVVRATAGELPAEPLPQQMFDLLEIRPLTEHLEEALAANGTEKQGETLNLSFFTNMVNPCYNSMSRSVYIRLSIEAGVKI